MIGKFEFIMIAVLGLPVLCHGETRCCVGAATASGARFDTQQACTALADEIDALRAMQRFDATVDYAVSLPMADDDVIYKIALASEKAPADSLLSYNYIIDWSLPGRGENASGFSAYFDGHYYNYRDHRLREYHYKWDSVPFLTDAGGVMRNAQFVDLFPFEMADRLAAMESDSTYTVSVAQTTVDGRKATMLKVVRNINSLECLRQEYCFAASDGMPLKISSLFNPGMLGEQVVTARYIYADANVAEVPDNEEQLRARYPEMFDRYRESNYSVENLRGTPVPGFALPTTTGERYTYHKGDPFPSPVIIAVLDPSVVTTAATVATLRGVVDSLPRQTTLILMFASSDIDAAEELAGPLRQGEALLVSAKPFVRDCGITAYPTVILAGSDGKVADVKIGTSDSMADDLLQAGVLLR